MATQTLSQQNSAPITLCHEKFPIRTNGESAEWLNEFHTKGWTVVRQVLSEDKALEYARKGYEWLENWNLGFNRNDPSSRKTEKLPFYTRGGLYARYGIGHEQFVWDLKSEPELVNKFEQLWGTNELLVSFDGVNLSVPEKERSETDNIYAPWSHVDQSPLRTHFDCAQGILNLLPNGPHDGGLMVLEGSSAFYTELWERFEYKKPEGGWHPWAQQNVDEEMCAWLVSKGCKWIKVCANPGDLMLWDSRTVHYGAPPRSTNPRFAAYVCYKPAALVPSDAREILREAFEQKVNTTHDPAAPRTKPRLPPNDHPSYEMAVKRPIQQPMLSKRARQLAGLDPY